MGADHPLQIALLIPKGSDAQQRARGLDAFHADVLELLPEAGETVTTITTLDDVKRLHTAALETIDTQHQVIVTVLRSGLVRQAVLNYLRDFEKE